MEGHPHPYELSHSAQPFSAISLASDCLCLKALITVPGARPLSSNRFFSLGEPRVAQTVLQSMSSTHSPTGALCSKPNTLLGGDREGTAKGLRRGQMKA